MEETILISYLNDFIYCPASIYFHNLYGNRDKLLYQREEQLTGTKVHKSIDEGTYTTSSDVLMGIEVYSEKYSIIGKIDMYDKKKKILTEKKKHIEKIYDGYIFQLYAQYFALKEMGFKVEEIRLYSIDDNKVYKIDIPEKNKEKFKDFETLIYNIRNFNINTFKQTNPKKCEKCIYEPACDRSLIC